jgi:hypothetical protein
MKPKNKKEVVVQVYAFYHKDIDATAKTAHLMINEAMETPKGQYSSRFLLNSFSDLYTCHPVQETTKINI